MLVNEKEEERKKERKKEDDESEFYGDILLDSRVLSGTFASVFVNC